MSDRYFYVKPKSRVSPQGRHTWQGPNGKPLDSTKSKGATFTFSILKNKNGLLNTGLDYFLPNNPYKAKTEEESLLPSNWQGSVIWKKERITRQEELEVKYNLMPGTLTNIPSKDRKNYTYIELFRYILYDRENRISLNDLKGEVFYEAARASSLIANSVEEASFSTNAHFYISRVNEDEEAKASKNRLKSRGASALEDLVNKGGLTKMRQVGLLLNIGNTFLYSEEAIYNKIYDFLNDEKKYSRNISLFLDIIDTMNNKSRKAQFDAEVFLKELVVFNVISESRGAFYWNSKRGTSLDNIGMSKESAVAWLMDKGNEVHIKELQQELKIKKNEY